ncbi:MAG: aldehyde dehydrogenase family protein, partial [Luteolibacter sp.]
MNCGPWNYPLQLLLVPLVSAIAAGNTAVLKPSEFAPATSHAVAKLLRSAFSDEHIAVVEGHAETSVALLEEKFDKIFFTGSTETGRRVMAAAAKHLTPLTLELGGKSPCIVAADAAIDVAARRIVWGKFMNAGQTCVAPDYLLVDEKIASRLINALRSAIVTFFGSDPQQSPDYGRIIHSRHLNRLLALIDGENVIHGGQHDPADLYLAPTLLGEASWDAPIMQEEIFGPILPILSFKSLDETLAQLSQLPPPLALYLFTEDRSTRDQVVKRTRSGGVCVNDTIVHIT